MSQIIVFFLNLSNNIKLYHWMTTSYARHKAADELFTNLLEHSDKFIEVYIGKYGRPSMAKTSNVQIQSLNDNTIIKFLDEKSKYLIQDLPKLLSQDDTDLFNIRDELLATINQTKYLFSLH
jgi:hypothetical protein